VSEVPYASRSQNAIPCCGSAIGHGFLFSREAPAILTALLASALITFSGEQAGSTEKWTAPAAEARKKNPVAANESSLAAGQKIFP